MAFDPDAYLAEKTAKSPKPQAFDPDAYLTSRSAAPKKINRTEGEKKAFLDKYPEDPLKKAGDIAESIYQMGSSLVATPIAGLAGIGTAATNALGITDTPAADVVERVSGALTYQPRSEGGNAAAAAIASPDVNPLAAPGALGENWADMATEAGASPLLATGIRTAPDALVALLGMRGLGKVVPGESPMAPLREPVNPYAQAPDATPIDTQAALNKAGSSQSMGAAGAAVDLQKLSPPLRSAVERAVRETGGAVNPEAMARQVQADSLPVKVNLSEGQALGDERLISLELNARGKHEIYSKGFAEQNKALTENLRAMREQSGPEVFSTNAVEHADTFIGRYKEIDEARNADIGAKYEALRDAAAGEFPIDTQALATNVRGALKKQLATNNAPPDIMGALDEAAASGKLSLEDFEMLRTRLASIQRSASDGQVRHAAGVIRQQIEEMPLAPGAEQLKGLADSARTAARERFAALEADPAYKAAVNDSVAPDAFVRKYVIGGTRDNVAKLSEAMSGDERAVQTLKVATLDHLRSAAGIDNGYNGNFTQAGYNKALQSLEAKLGSLLDPATAETARTLGDVARYTQFQPKGSFANNSNTFVSAAAEKAADALEGVLNYKTGGIPVASSIRKAMNEGKIRKQAERTFAPGAGLTKLSELAKLKEPK